jgi:hypothetical protein
MRKWASAVAIIILLAGVLSMLASRTSVEYANPTIEVAKLVGTSEKPILIGANVTGYFSEGEKISVRFNHNLSFPMPEEVFIGFSAIEPSGYETRFEFELTALPPDFVTIGILNLTVTQIGSLVFDNSSKSTFVATATQKGNYTCVYRSPWNGSIRALFLEKLTSTLVYPNAFLLPTGATFLIIGILLLVWGAKSSPKRKRSVIRKKR